MRKLSRTTIDQPGMAPYRRQIRAIMHQSGADARRAAAEAKRARKNVKRLRDVAASAGPRLIRV